MYSVAGWLPPPLARKIVNCAEKTSAWSWPSEVVHNRLIVQQYKSLPPSTWNSSDFLGWTFPYYRVWCVQAGGVWGVLEAHKVGVMFTSLEFICVICWEFTIFRISTNATNIYFLHPYLFYSIYLFYQNLLYINIFSNINTICLLGMFVNLARSTNPNCI